MEVVLDTSALIAPFAKNSPFRPIYSALLAGKFESAVSTEILLEYAEKIEEKTTPSVSHTLLELLTLLPNVRLQEIFYNWNPIISDPDDNKFVDCYIAAGADYLVSNDRHFSVLKPDDFPTIQMVRVEEVMEVLSRL
ncbi:MAG: putative toxin-antitoxin system toxin component, PIN family [Saprospiraceae bacterium]|nr:putative toxin-antitoxin system toxin component, PIN family [Saprospiraceae bacterium]